jgi:hypothetical protein
MTHAHLGKNIMRWIVLLYAALSAVCYVAPSIEALRSLSYLFLFFWVLGPPILLMDQSRLLVPSKEALILYALGTIILFVLLVLSQRYSRKGKRGLSIVLIGFSIFAWLIFGVLGLLPGV